MPYNEAVEIGAYLAHLRHYITQTCWSTSFQSEKRLFPRLNRPYEKGLCYPQIKMSSCSFADGFGLATTLDNIVYTSCDVKTITHQLEQYKNIVPHSYWNSWTEHIFETLCAIGNFNEFFQRHHLWTDLIYEYVREQERLNERVAGKEFRDLLDLSQHVWNEAKENKVLPIPVQRVGSESLWTVGQVEFFIYELVYQDGEQPWLRKRNEYFSGQEFSLRLCFEDPDGDVYDFHNSIKFYYSHFGGDLAIHFAHISEISSVIELYNYFKSRVQIAPELDYAMAQFYLRNGNYSEAKPYLAKALELYQSVIPDDFEGKIYADNNDQYLYGLCDMAFLEYLDGNLEIAFALLEQGLQLSYDTDALFEEIHDKMTYSKPNSFTEWYIEKWHTIPVT